MTTISTGLDALWIIGLVLGVAASVFMDFMN